MTYFPLRALTKGLVFIETLLRSVVLISIFLSLLFMRMVDTVLVYIMGHWSTNMIFQSWTVLVLCSYTTGLPVGITQSQWFLQLEALVWILRTSDLFWTLPKLAIRLSFYMLTARDENYDFFTLKWKWRSPRTSRALKTIIPTSFQEAKNLAMILIGLYWCIFVPIARAAPSACPLYTANMGPGRWFRFYAAFRAYLIRKDIYIFDEKNPDDLLTGYPNESDTLAIQILKDFGIAHRAAFICASMKAKACFEEATAAYGPLCIIAAKANTYSYADAVVE